MFDHKCTLLNAYVPIEYQHVDSGMCISLRRRIHTLCMIDEQHPMTIQYFKSSNMRRQEQIRHLSNNPFVIHPFSLVALFWEFAFFVVYTLISLIICLTLMDQHQMVKRYLLYIKRLFDVFLFLDVIKNFLTGFYHQEKYGSVMKPQLLAKHYLKSYFLLDFLPITPSIIQLYRYFVRTNETVNTIFTISRFFNLLKISRLPRSCKSMDLWRQYFKFSTNVSGMATIVYRYVMIIVWLYGVVFYVDFIVDRYVMHMPSKMKHIGAMQTFFAYTRLLLHSSCGLDDTKHPLDIIFTVCFIGVAYGVHLYLHCQVLQGFRRFTNARSQNDTLLEHFKAYVQYKGLPLTLREMFFEFFRFKYQNEYFNETRINEILSKNLRENIQVQVSKDHIRKVEFLKHIPPQVMTALVSRMKSEIYLANDTIVVAGVPGNCMYFIHFGTVAVYTPSGKEMCHLKDGAHFGEIALIFNEPRIASIVAVTPCQLFVLKRSDFSEVINVYPKFKKQVISMANQRLSLVKDRNATLSATGVN